MSGGPPRFQEHIHWEGLCPVPSKECAKTASVFPPLKEVLSKYGCFVPSSDAEKAGLSKGKSPAFAREAAFFMDKVKMRRKKKNGQNASHSSKALVKGSIKRRGSHFSLSRPACRSR